MCPSYSVSNRHSRPPCRTAGIPATERVSAFSAATTRPSTGLPHSGVYAVGTHHLTRYDVNSGHHRTHDFGVDEPGEAVFVPASTGTGYLLLFVFRPETGTSDLAILDAGDPAAAPVAEVHLGVRIPAGFHGNWFPDTPTEN
ncbi:carotenoid oxygenase family protein [Nocardia sp. NPDC019395]|uniref:carotenoid oxygenase family protein n=1 Tax=Nocardia sp. NPDC019395 TaxID=3154686 RepID=UPI0033E67F27